MCGIYGIVRFDGNPIESATLSAMGRVTSHRGPDDEGQHIDHWAAIGMRRLSIIDLSGGHQPLSNEDETIWLVCNGEIYNFRELRTSLQAKGHRFKTGSDCEVLIHLYEEYGDDFVQHLNGMYGFALWDSRRKRMLVGRDRLGIKPIYIYRSGSILAFSSEAKAFLALPGFSPDVDHGALRSFIGLGYVPAPQSIFKGVEKLPVASMMVIEGGKTTVGRYWSISGTIDRATTERDWIERVRKRLEQSVRMQMVSDVPIGAFLSGGVDSSAVVAYMAAASDLPIKTYAIGFDGGGADSFYNELPYARRVSELFKTDHHEIIVRPDVVSLLPRLAWHMDEPIADTAFVTTYLVSEFARKDVTVILSGVGGDELFGGYRRYLGSRYQAYLDHLPRGVRQLLARVARRLPSDRHSPLLNAARLARGFLASVDQPFDERYRSYVEVFPRDEQAQLLRTNGVDSWDALANGFRMAQTEDALNRLLVVDAETQLPDDLLLLTDKMSMAVSLECRVPLLDHELVELAARMPESIKIRGGRLKHLMKEAVRDKLPDDILDRKKRGFGMPMGAWLKRELAQVMRHLLSERAVNARGFFNHAVISQLIAAHDANRVDGTDRLLALLNFEVWCRIFLDRRSPEDVTLELKEIAA